MDSGFSFAELDKNFRSAVAYVRRELRFLQNLENCAGRAVLRLIFGLDLDAGGGHAVFPDFFGGELPAGDPETAQFGAEEFHVAAGINEGAERHVTANARKTVEISEFHGMPPSGWDCRPKHLSAGCRLILSAVG